MSVREMMRLDEMDTVGQTEERRGEERRLSIIATRILTTAMAPTISNDHCIGLVDAAAPALPKLSGAHGWSLSGSNGAVNCNGRSIANFTNRAARFTAAGSESRVLVIAVDMRVKRALVWVEEEEEEEEEEGGKRGEEEVEVEEEEEGDASDKENIVVGDEAKVAAAAAASTASTADKKKARAPRKYKLAATLTNLPDSVFLAVSLSEGCAAQALLCPPPFSAEGAALFEKKG